MIPTISHFPAVRALSRKFIGQRFLQFNGDGGYPAFSGVVVLSNPHSGAFVFRVTGANCGVFTDFAFSVHSVPRGYPILTATAPCQTKCGHHLSCMKWRESTYPTKATPKAFGTESIKPSSVLAKSAYGMPRPALVTPLLTTRSAITVFCESHPNPQSGNLLCTPNSLCHFRMLKVAPFNSHKKAA